MEAASQTINHIENPNLLATKIIVPQAHPREAAARRRTAPKCFFQRQYGFCFRELLRGSDLLPTSRQRKKTLHPPGVFYAQKAQKMPAHLWKNHGGRAFWRFVRAAVKSIQRAVGLGGTSRKKHYRAARCLQKSSVKMSLPFFASKGISVCVPSGGNAHKLFAFRNPAGSARPYPAGGLRQAACGFKCHTQVFPIRPCGHILPQKGCRC